MVLVVVSGRVAATAMGMHIILVCTSTWLRPQGNALRIVDSIVLYFPKSEEFQCKIVRFMGRATQLIGKTAKLISKAKVSKEKILSSLTSQ